MAKSTEGIIRGLIESLEGQEGVVEKLYILQKTLEEKDEKNLSLEKRVQELESKGKTDLGLKEDPKSSGEESSAVACPFDKLFAKNVPHIVENIFLSLDYESFKKCMRVSNAWKKILTSQPIQQKAKSVYKDGIKKDEMMLWYHSRGGKTEEVRRLLSSRMLNINVALKPWWLDISMWTTPMFEAADRGHKEVVQLLIKEGVELEKGDIIGRSPLFAASCSGHEDVVEMLLDAGASPKSRRSMTQEETRCW